MASYDRPRDPTATDPRHPELTEPSWYGFGVVLPLVLAAAIAIVLILMFNPFTTVNRAEDTNAGPSVQTVTPSPSPSTLPAGPSPTPTTEPRPTQAPIQ
jgi:hypothetical protein